MQIDTDRGSAGPVVVLLHGFMGLPEDLAPFARSLGVSARFVLPEGFVDLSPRGLRGRGWWPLDVEATPRAVAGTPGDLSDMMPEGLDVVRARMDQVLYDIEREMGDRRLIMGGFSQGAMLACDLVLRSTRRVEGLAMFSGARIAASAWRPRYAQRRGLRVFMSHGTGDRELSFESADSFQQELNVAGWAVTWVPFHGGHEIPLVVWRAFKRWLSP